MNKPITVKMNGRTKAIRKKVIDGTFHADGDKTLTRNVMLADSFEEYVLNLQEEYPDKKITRKSILHWKFMTVGELNKLKETEEFKQWNKPK